LPGLPSVVVHVWSVGHLPWLLPHAVPQESKPQLAAPQAGFGVHAVSWHVPGLPPVVLHVLPTGQPPSLLPQAVPQLSKPQSEAPQAGFGVQA